MDVQVGPPVVTIYDDDQILVCAREATICAEKQQGYFCADTRLVSSYRVQLSRTAPVLLNSSEVEAFSARFEFINARMFTPRGWIDDGQVHLRLDRTIGDGIHEDYELTNYHGSAVEVDLELFIGGDYADLFDVREGRLVRRGSLQTMWDQDEQVLTTSYANGDFRRGLRLQVARNDSPPEFTNGALSFRVQLAPHAGWHTCLLWEPRLDGATPMDPARGCHALCGDDSARDRLRRKWIEQVPRIEVDHPAASAAVTSAVTDLAAMRLHRSQDMAASAAQDAEGWVPAAGVPWYVTLFGRDALMVSLQTLLLSPKFALASLEALAALQGDRYDDSRDLEPGKIAHEMRYGELAHLGLIPQTPYYGTHDASTLFIWTAGELWRWLGDRAVLARLRPHVERALAWIDTDGDLDGDGLQEYHTRAGEWGFYNQGWKDSGEAMVHHDGTRVPLPIAAVELQGYVVAAKRRWADVMEEAFDEPDSAHRLRVAADRLAATIEDRFWWDAEGTYYLGLDAHKRPIESVSSNPGHLLWAQAISPERATRVAQRLLAEDMWTGWGIRTLSSGHAAYNPFSYQRGSVWPHDNAVLAAGCRRYNLTEASWQIARGLFDAAARFQHARLPEVFAGLQRDRGAFPVQYLEANTPQAWASGAVVHVLEALAGLAPDAGRGRLVVRPKLPDWLGEPRLHGMRVGQSKVDLRLCGTDAVVTGREGALLCTRSGRSRVAQVATG